MGLDGGANVAVVRLCGVFLNLCGGACPRKVGGGGGVVLHRAYIILWMSWTCEDIKFGVMRTDSFQGEICPAHQFVRSRRIGTILPVDRGGCLGPFGDGGTVSATLLHLFWEG